MLSICDSGASFVVSPHLCRLILRNWSDVRILHDHARTGIPSQNGYDRVRDALRQNALTIFQSATKAAASRAQSVAAELQCARGSTGGNTSARGGGLLGGVSSTAGVATGAVANSGVVATGATNSTLGSVGNSGKELQGALNSSSTGVVGLKDLSLASGAANSTQGSVISSTGKSVRLDGGTQMVLRVVNQ
jgi:hypothetical protein